VTPGERAFDAAVLVGRFQPLHLGHLAAMRAGLARAERLVVLSAGARQPRSTRVPFRFAEARESILGALGAEERARVRVEPLLDRYDEAGWREEVARAVGEAGRVALIGAEGEAATRIRRFFPGWEGAEIAGDWAARTKEIREDYLGDAEAALARWAEALPGNVADFLRRFAGSADYAELAAEAAYIAEYRALWAGAPWPPIFVTVDALVLAAGHVLLVERGKRPGRGLWALPGGFVEARERIAAALPRELAEETGLLLPAGAIGAPRVFDAPCRSARGRTITHVFPIVLAAEAGLPDVAGGDDAARAFWQPIEAIDPERMFEDHGQIIAAMLDEVRAKSGGF
jgi:bifunctional NMN adenylyltransferase/nudix hydrolase